MGGMYAKIIGEKRETEKILRRCCPKCKKLMHEINGKWVCNYCGDEIKEEMESLTGRSK